MLKMVGGGVGEEGGGVGSGVVMVVVEGGAGEGWDDGSDLFFWVGVAIVVSLSRLRDFGWSWGEDEIRFWFWSEVFQVL